MARNLLDDDDWNHLASIVTRAVDAAVGDLDAGTLARLDRRSQDQSITLDAVKAQLGEPAAETVALRTQVVEAAAKVAQLRRTVGSGNLQVDLQAQVDALFDETVDALGGIQAPAQPAKKKEK